MLPGQFERTTNLATEIVPAIGALYRRIVNPAFCDLKPGTMVAVVYYFRYRDEYCQITGAVEKVDAFWHFLQIGNKCIDFCGVGDVSYTERV